MGCVAGSRLLLNMRTLGQGQTVFTSNGMRDMDISSHVAYDPPVWSRPRRNTVSTTVTGNTTATITDHTTVISMSDLERGHTDMHAEDMQAEDPDDDS